MKLCLWDFTFCLKDCSSEKLADGQTRVLLGVQNAQPAFHGGNVTLRRGNVVIDQDPVILR